jgi:dTDP-4-amino-4,6-dideoxygalactose transaminase
MILMNDFKAEPEELKVAELEAVERVLRSGWYVLGNEVKVFEQLWAKTCGIAYAVGVGNGMDAIEVGLRALNIADGDEVITTPMTAFATVLAIIRAGATPVLADIDPASALLDPASVERCVSSRTKAVLLVHLYGQMRDMGYWTSLCERHGIALLEDCAQSHFARWDEKAAGSFGGFGAYSFYPTKNLGALGDAGALVSNDGEIARRASVLRNYGQSVRYHHTELGLNSRLDELQAALLRVRLEYLYRFTARRREIAKAYRDAVDNIRIRLLAKPMQVESHVYHLYVLLCSERDRLSEHLKQCEIESYIHYPVPIHFQEPCKGLRRDPIGLQMSEVHSKNCLSIPCHPQMTDSDVSAVINAINAFK